MGVGLAGNPSVGVSVGLLLVGVGTTRLLVGVGVGLPSLVGVSVFGNGGGALLASLSCCSRVSGDEPAITGCRRGHKNAPKINARHRISTNVSDFR